jgi:hypothetical protein
MPPWRGMRAHRVDLVRQASTGSDGDSLAERPGREHGDRTHHVSDRLHHHWMNGNETRLASGTSDLANNDNRPIRLRLEFAEFLERARQPRPVWIAQIDLVASRDVAAA